MQRPAGGFRAKPQDHSLDPQPVQLILAGENLLLRARQVSRRIGRRIRKALSAHGPPAPPGKVGRQGGGGGANGEGRGRGLRAGDRIRLTPASSFEGYCAGDTGRVVSLSRGPGNEVAFVHCVMDRTGPGQVATFCPEEVEPAD